MGTTLEVRRPLETEGAGIAIDDDFTSSYRASLGRLVGFFRAKGVPREEAADLANETIVRMLVHLKRHGRDRADLGPLVRTIARNLLVERVRKQAPVIVPLGDDIDVADDELEPVDQLVMSERRQAVRQAIGSLSPRHRHVVGMWMEGRTPAEIARELGIKRNAVDAILHRARRSLAAKLDGGGVMGVFGLAFIRLRVLSRRVAEIVGSIDPTGQAAPAASLTLAAASLAAVLTISGAPPHASADPRVGGGGEGAVSSTVDGARDAASAARIAAPDDAHAKAPRVAESTAYQMNVGQILSPSSEDESESVAQVSYDPDKNGRGPLDDVLESVFKGCVAAQTCFEVKQ
jgi:RNA polymerase sigma-70 factor (ECF subfamily)